MTPRENIAELVDQESEFNIIMDMEILQQATRQGEPRQAASAAVEATLHVTPKVHHKVKRARKKRR